MSGLFIAILNMSFAGSIAVLIVLAVRFLMNIGRLPGRYRSGGMGMASAIARSGQGIPLLPD